MVFDQLKSEEAVDRSLKVWILQTGEPLHLDKGTPRSMRAMNLADALVSAGHTVTVYSSDFSHSEKRHRYKKYQEISINDKLRYRLIPSPGYQSHIGLGRLYDHWMMGRNLKRLLAKEKSVPDVAFIGYPPIEVAYHMGRWLRCNRVPYLIDVKDQWPHLFVDALPSALRRVGRIALAPYFYMAATTMRKADGITSMASSFLDWALKFANREKRLSDRVFPLTTPNQKTCEHDRSIAADFWKSQGLLTSRVKVVFIGTHSKAFDMTPLVEAADFFSKKNNTVDFIICGHGPQTEIWKEQFGSLDNVFFAGWVDKAQIDVLMESSLAVLAPYRNTENFITNLPNKVVDALSYGKPILTGLRGEVEALIKADQVGMFYEPSGISLQQCIEVLMNNSEYLRSLEASARRVYAERYDFHKVYNGLVECLEELSREGGR